MEPPGGPRRLAAGGRLLRCRVRLTRSVTIRRVPLEGLALRVHSGLRWPDLCALSCPVLARSLSRRRLRERPEVRSSLPSRVVMYDPVALRRMLEGLSPRLRV